VLESIPVSERASDIQTVNLSRDELPVERTLGVQWNVKSDILSFEIQERQRPDTCRGILSMIQLDSYRHLSLRERQFYKKCASEACHGMIRFLTNFCHDGISGNQT